MRFSGTAAMVFYLASVCAASGDSDGWGWFESSSCWDKRGAAPSQETLILLSGSTIEEFLDKLRRTHQVDSDIGTMLRQMQEVIESKKLETIAVPFPREDDCYYYEMTASGIGVKLSPIIMDSRMSECISQKEVLAYMITKHMDDIVRQRQVASLSSGAARIGEGAPETVRWASEEEFALHLMQSANVDIVAANTAATSEFAIWKSAAYSNDAIAGLMQAGDTPHGYVIDVTRGEYVGSVMVSDSNANGEQGAVFVPGNAQAREDFEGGLYGANLERSVIYFPSSEMTGSIVSFVDFAEGAPAVSSDFTSSVNYFEELREWYDLTPSAEQSEILRAMYPQSN